MYYNSNRFILITNLECRLVLSSLRSLIIAVSWDTVECPSPDKVEHSDSRLTDELPFTSAENIKIKNNKKNCPGGVMHITHIKQRHYSNFRTV